MDLKEIVEIIKKAKRIDVMILLATKAYHWLGDASRKEPSLCLVSGETEKFFTGCWYKSSFLADVIFPKKTTRRISSIEEIEKYLNPYHIDTRDLGYISFLFYRE